MSTFSIILILGILLIIGGLSLMSTPLITFIGAGYFIIILFFVHGIFGVIRGLMEKQFDKGFFFSIVSLILGLVGLFVPGAAAMGNSVLLYMAAAWFLVHAVMTIIDAIAGRQEGEGIGSMILGILLGVAELVLAIISAMHPAVLADVMGVLIGFYYMETGFNLIAVGSALCKGSNHITLLYTIMGVLAIIGGISMLATPLLTFVSTGYAIIALFFLNGIVGIIGGISEKRYDKDFFLSILSLILGIVGCIVPGAAAMTNDILLFIAAGWFIIRGILSIVNAFESKKNGAGTFVWILGIVLGVAEIILGVVSFIYPSIAATISGILIGFYFIETGANMIFTGSRIAKGVAEARNLSRY